MLEDVYPLTPLQEGLYYHWLRSPDSETYLDQISFTIKGKLDIGVMEQSYRLLAARHAVLRTFFTHDYGDKPLQVVRKDTMPGFEYRDAAAMAGLSMANIRKEDRLKGFNLNKGSQMRLTIWETSAGVYEFIWTYHHILMDGWCLSILMNDFLKIYYSCLQGKEPSLKKIRPYSNYIKWLSAMDKDSSLGYWKNYLSGYSHTTGLPRLLTPEANASPRISKQVLYLEGALRQQIKDCCAECQVTENTFLQAAWAILLAKYNQTNEVVFGAVVSGRPPELEGVEEMIGLFINNIPVRIQLQDRIAVADLLKEIQKQYLQGARHHYIQLADIQAASEAGNGLFDHILVFENYPVQHMSAKQGTSKEAATRPDLQMVAATSFQQNNYDLTLTIVPGDTIRIDFSFNEHRFEPAQIERLRSHIVTIMEQMVRNPWAAAIDTPYLQPDELAWLMEAATGHSSHSLPYDTIVHAFESQAALHPANQALACDQQVLTYAELEELSGLLAGHLRQQYHITKGQLVALKLDRTEWLIVALWGILRCGAAYLPIDPAWPDHRVAQIMEDSQCKCLVDASFMEAFHKDRVGKQQEPWSVTVTPEDLAYVIYTSGSTGTPKGVMVSHAALMDYCNGLLNATSIGACTSFGWVSTIAADLGNTVLFPAFLTGGKLQVYTETELSKPAEMSNKPVDCLKITPSHWKALQGKEFSFLPGACLVFGGEPLTPDVISLLVQQQATCTVYNHYGPAETTVGKLLTPVSLEGPTVKIALGAPFGNNQVYIMDEQLKLAGIGITGEICISGAGLSGGYLHQPVLTAERFVPHPLKPGERLYRTGDLGRWLEDKTIEFIGRKDDQVKIRGFRVEPGEIEQQLLKLEHITGAVVLAYTSDQGDKRLAAYITASETIHPAALQATLAQALPSYMVPAHLVQLPAFPLTANGKIDKRALPLPLELAAAQSEIVGPRNAVEEQLLHIWSDVLGVDPGRIGVKASFFELGGHSLTAIRTVLRIREQMAVDIDLTQFFNHPVIETIATEIENIRWLRETAASTDTSGTTIII